MGLFSWVTSDTNRSISCEGSDRPTFTVHMITRDGQVFTENNYEGYGVFGGKDIFVLVAELNGQPTGTADEIRNIGHGIYWGGKPFHRPKFVEHLPNKGNWEAEWDRLPKSEECEHQGYFYPVDEEEEEPEDYCENCSKVLRGGEQYLCTECEDRYYEEDGAEEDDR